MKKFLVIMSHEMSNTQEEDAHKNLGVDEVIQAPTHIKDIWKDINPSNKLPVEDINKVINWIENNSVKGDYILVQGEFGATYYVVSYCIKNNLKPVYATSKRSVVEIIQGNKVITERVFRHEGFREYIAY